VNVDIRALTPADQDAILGLDQWAFAFNPDDVDPAPSLDSFEWDRIHGAQLPDSPGLAGIYAAYSLDLPVPGGSLPVAGLTWVGVHPLHRRKGVLTAMIRRHLEQVRERGEAISALNAAEQPIYGRYGYGMAGRQLSMTVPRGAQLQDVAGSQQLQLRLDKADVEKHTAVVAECYEAARRLRPGMVSRSTPGLQRIALVDQAWMRAGAESLRILTCEDGGGRARGYALFRRKASWSGGEPDGTVRVRELVALDPAAAHTLWGRLFDLDLMSSVETDERPTDDALLHLMVNWRAAAPRLADGIWIRLVDLPAALAARRYSAPVEVVLQVADELCPTNAGRWWLKGGPDGAVCEATTSAADLALDVRDLGAAYLGSQTLDSLAAAGLVRELREGRLAHASAAFAWPVAAFCGWRF
jgi:predicted acetyltransferase